MEINDMDPYEYLLKTLDIQIIDRHNRYREIWFKNQFIDSFNFKLTAKELFWYYNNYEDLDLIQPSTPNILDLVQLLGQFPAELESKKHVDLLLTLNGLNKGA